MKTLEKSHEKIKKICDSIQHEVLAPAKKEAEEIIEQAKKEAHAILEEAKKEKETLLEQAKRTIQQERSVFESSLLQATKQSVESLKQSIENNLFNNSLHEFIADPLSEPKIIASLITAIVNALEKEGMQANLSAIIPQKVPAKDVNALLSSNILNRLKEHSVQVGHFEGGALVKLNGKNITIDITDSAVKELLASYLRKDFRKMIFST